MIGGRSINGYSGEFQEGKEETNVQTAREIVLRALFMKWDEIEECHEIELGIISAEPEFRVQLKSN